PVALPEEPLQYFNGWGGFTEDGREYVIRLSEAASRGLAPPPYPWINVIANPDFGFLVSETGSACTWSMNSREHRITPWANDPLRPQHAEALLLRDEESGRVESPLPGPAPGPGAYHTRHGIGYSTFLHAGRGMQVETCMFVPPADPVRLCRVRLTNSSSRP